MLCGGSLANLSRPEALGSTGGYSVRQRQRLLWPHPRHSRPPGGLFPSPVEYLWSRVGPQFELCVCLCMPSPAPRWIDAVQLTVASRAVIVFATFALARHPRRHARWFSRGLRHEAESGSLALRPAQWLAFHQQRLLRPSFRQRSHPTPTSVITTWKTVNYHDQTFTG